jgi:hypothetical protein
MSDSTYEPGDENLASVYEPDDAGMANDRATDVDLTFGDTRADQDGDLYDRGYSPPERPPVNMREGSTWSDQSEPETLDERVAQEIPDPNLAADLGQDDSEDEDSQDETVDEEDLVYGEVGSERAGRLVDPDEGTREDTEKDLVGDDVGIDAGAASAEEAAIHIIE